MPETIPIVTQAISSKSRWLMPMHSQSQLSRSRVLIPAHRHTADRITLTLSLLQPRLFQDPTCQHTDMVTIIHGYIPTKVYQQLLGDNNQRVSPWNTACCQISVPLVINGSNPTWPFDACFNPRFMRRLRIISYQRNLTTLRVVIHGFQITSSKRKLLGNSLAWATRK